MAQPPAVPAQRPAATPQQQTVTFQAQFERLKAFVESLMEARKVSNEKMMTLSERMGELRTLITEQEKNVREMRGAATRAIDLVEKTQPEVILKEVRKQEAKIDALRAKQDANEGLLSKLTEELKEMRRQMGLFRGVEQLQKLSEEVKADLMNLKRLEGSVKRHADRVENLFVETQKKFTFEKLAKRVDEAEKLAGELAKDFDKVRVAITGLPRKEDAEKLNRRIEEGLRRLEEAGSLAVPELAEFAREGPSAIQALHQRLTEAERQVAALRARSEPRPRKAQAAPLPEAPKTRESLEAARKETEAFLENLDTFRQKGSISDVTYKELRQMSQEKLADIAKELGQS